ncbi:hypothetical protein BOS5A_10067 [Bosea sp. EC-HK365B]|nr:hypothetical protein BOS5A_10067 [Bosea sp. EC-HK365B]VXC32037.1 hypothetical protein BOSE127_180134 [Bosea sp. 127]
MYGLEYQSGRLLAEVCCIMFISLILICCL